MSTANAVTSCSLSLAVGLNQSGAAQWLVDSIVNNLPLADLSLVPLLLFGMSATRVRMSTLGVMQYLTPTMQLSFGVLMYGEPFGDQAAGTVVNSAPDPGGGALFLAVAQIQAADAGSMAIGAPDGPRATREALPYALPDPAPPRGRPLR